jgi:hypothetical protein
MKKDEAGLADPARPPFGPQADGTVLRRCDGLGTKFAMIGKDGSISPRPPEPWLDDVKAAAKARAMPRQRFIRLAMDRALVSPK